MPVIPTNSPIKTRGLKNADREVDFFFMNGYEWNLNVKRRFYAKREKRVNTFFIFLRFVGDVAARVAGPRL